MAKNHDPVIETGTAASVSPSRCRAAGWSVARMDYLPFGGTCALRGCYPEKVRVGAADASDHVSQMRHKGVEGDAPSIAWQEPIAFKRTFTDPVPAMKEQNFAKNGIDFYHGSAQFCGPRSVTIAGQTLNARFIVLAAGAVSKPMNVPDEEHAIDSAQFLELALIEDA
ncbi:FAD-dependent oxidoreductase [Burkholderia cenocepacia]|uniref:FAD-dependent oxidoreductase n=1 Tax=Burkholderia cenocepacia TaxID=95486 RepID=UPI002AB64685|nr:FAD-dependent oxidoreductase [Burkholderia cenocepacia]